MKNSFISSKLHPTRSQPRKSAWRRYLDKHVDFNIQIWMLVALIFLEVGLVLIGIYYLHIRFLAIIEANLYRIHHGSDPLLFQLLTEVGGAVAILVGINLLALFVTDRVWWGHVKGILNAFIVLVNKVADLDFTQDEKPFSQHKVLDQTLLWRKKERERALAIREALKPLDAEADFSDPIVLDRLRQQLTLVRQHLPPYSRRYVGRLK